MSNIPPVNNIELDRGKLVDVLEYLGYRVGEVFSHPIRLVVHGGACMLLHPGLYNLAEQQARLTPNMPIRRTTRDVDYIHRAFVEDCKARGELDAPGKLLVCIQETAVRFGLGADWMNSAADVALPMTTDPTGRKIDPIYSASIQKSNIDFHTIFSSANGMLRLFSVAPFWAVSLKLVRYTKWDPFDICLLLKYGTIVTVGSAWSRHNLEQWLYTYCWSMGYANYPPEKKAQMRQRIDHAIRMVNEWFAKTPTLKEFSSTGFRTDAERRQPSSEMLMGTEGLDANCVEWGGGDRTGWKASFAGDWVKPHDKPTQPPPQQFTYLLATQPQAPTNQNTTSQLSPLFTPHNQQLLTLESAPHPRISSNVADWVVEKDRDRPRQPEEQPRWEWRQEQGDILEPFVPPVETLEGSHRRRGHNEGVVRRGTEEHPGPQRPELQRRANSQPIPFYKSQTSLHGLYQNSPVPNPPIYHQAPPVSHPSIPQTQSTSIPIVWTQQQPSPMQQTPPISGPPAFILNTHSSPYALPTPPVIYQYTPPMNICIRKERKKKDKARHKSREKARSAKHSRHSRSPEGIYTLDSRRVSHRSPKSEESDDDDDDDEDDPPVPITPPSHASPKVYPLTTVVYYNQHQEQQKEKKQKQHKASPSFSASPQPSPRQTDQVYYTQPPPPTWISPSAGPVPSPSQHVSAAGAQSQMIVSNGGRFASPVPATAIYSHSPHHHSAVIPPQEYHKPEKTGTLSKIMSVLKI